MSNHVLLVGCGGFVGASCRYLVSVLLQGLRPSSAFPLATLTVNVVGCLLIGFLLGLPLLQKSELRLLVVTGFLGGFTTFSTFGYETVQLIQQGAWPRAGLYVIGSVGAGIAGVLAGQFLAGWLR
jgi:CrcB protein